MGKITGKILYGFLFVAVIPALLIIWAKFTASLIRLPLPENHFWGYALSAVGIIFMITGMLHLWIYGKGLPMNAFPPRIFVKNGIYSFSKNPIYGGAVMASFGLSILLDSSSGFWLVSPIFALMVTAYTLGFETEHTRQIFGHQDYRTFLTLPENSEHSPKIGERLAAYFIAYLPWFFIYEAFILAGNSGDAFCSNFYFENQWPVLQSTVVFYVLTYLFAFLVPWVIRSKKDLRSFEIDILFATILCGLTYFLIPSFTRQRLFISHSLMGNLILLDRSFDGASASLPSFHVVWAFVAARYFSHNLKKLKWLWYLLAVLISISCITTANHSLADVVAAIILLLIVFYRGRIWDFIRLQSEHIANSWAEWRFGPVRVINHGFYAGAAGFAGSLIIGSFVDSKYSAAGFVICIFGIVGAGLWAQFVEGSPRLQRPYGYYGSVIGGAIGCMFVTFIFSLNFFILLAATAMAAPWIQILGRLRCLVQGCCHGKPAKDWLGICFTHPYSRVNKISGLTGIPLHPTQLYSIATNLITGLILIRLFRLGMPANFIIGIYSLLNGMGRFVEEAYRGEAQTPYWAGMRIYQWIAIVTILLGAVFTAIPDIKMVPFQFNLQALYWAVAVGLLSIIAYGVDFPLSNRRFARLTSA